MFWKKGIAFLLALTFVLSLTTCFAEEAPTVITVWSNDAHSKGVFEETVAKFNQTIGKEQGIVIELSVYGTDYYSTLDVAVQSGDAPYIFKCNKVQQYANAGKIACWEDMPGGAELAAPYADMNSEGVGLVNGRTYTVPFKSTTVGLAYNKELFAKLNLTAPTTWDEMRECARVITENGNGLIYGYGLGMSYVSYPLFFILPCASASTGTMHFNFNTMKYDFAALTPYMELMMNIIDDGSMFPGYETMDDDTKRAQFAAGNIGMIPVFSPDVAVLTEQFPATFDWGVIPYPTQTADTRYKTWSSPSTFYAINQDAITDGVQDKVMTVMNTLLGEDHLLRVYENEKDMITRADIKAKATPGTASEQWLAFGNGDVNYTGFGFPDGLLAIEGNTYKEVFDKILVGITTPADGLADLDTRYNAALDAAVADGTIKLDDFAVPNYAELIAYTAQ